MNIEQISKDYERDGVVRVKQFLSCEEVKIVRSEIENYAREIAPKLEASEVTFEADGKTGAISGACTSTVPFLTRFPESRKP